MLFRTCVVFAVLLAATSPARADTNITGAWNGQFTLTDHCDNGGSYTSNGVATASFSQNGTSVTGNVTSWNAIETNGSDCTPRPPASLAIAITGTVTGSSFVGVLAVDGGTLPISGSMGSTSMTLSFPADPTTSGTFTLSRTSSQTDITGRWSGTITETVAWSSSSGSCSNGTPATVTSSGPATLAIAQNGSSFLGSMIFPHNWHDVDPSPTNLCSLVDSGPVARVVSGVVSGSTIIASTPLALSVSGSTITGSFPEGAEALEHGSFTLTRESSLPAGTDLMGTWSGTMNESFMWGAGSESCPNGTPAPFTTNGQSTLAIAQNGSSFAGALTFPHLWMDHSDGSGNCSWVEGGTYAVTLSGTVSGSTITGSATGVNAMTGASVTVPLTLSVSGSTITGSLQEGIESASFILTKQSSAPSRRRAAVH
jgi:hypothetical protein